MQGGQAHGHIVQHPVLGLSGPLRRLDVLPAQLLRRAGDLRILVREHMGMPPDQLLGHGVGHVVEGEQALFLGHPGMEDDLEQQVPKLALQFAHVAPLDGVGDLIGLLDRIGGDGLEGLLHVPRTAAVGVPQPDHDLLQPVDRAHASRASS